MFTLDKYEYPIDWEKVQMHRKANRIGKLLTEDEEDQLDPNQIAQQILAIYMDINRCECCGRKIAETPQCSIFTDIEERYGRYGPNVKIYINMLKKMTLLLLFLSLIFSAYSLIVNPMGHYCNKQPQNCKRQNFFYLISVYNILDDSQTKFVQLVLLIAVSIVIFIFNIHLRIYAARKYEKINNKNITDADYSILVRRLPAETKSQDLYELGKSFIKDATDEDLQKTDHFSIHDVIMLKQLDEAVQIYEQNLKEFKKHIKNNQQARTFVPKDVPQPSNFAKTAIIRFNSIHANELIDMRTSLRSKFIQYIFPFINAKTKFKVRDKNVAIIRAPQPSDIIWRNLGLKDSSRIKKKIFYWLIAIIFLLISAGILYGLTEGEEALTALVGGGVQWYSAMMTILVFIFNNIIYAVLWISAQSEKLSTQTQKKIDLLQKTVIFQTANLGFFSIFVPFLVKLPALREGAQSISLPLVTTITMILQAFAWPTLLFLMKYFQVFTYRIPKFFIKHNCSIYTQKQANRILEPEQIEFVSIYSVMIRFLFFGCVFSTISPICFPIACIGCLLTLIYERILIDTKYKIPEYGSPQINSEVIDILDLAPLLMSIINLGLNLLANKVLALDEPTYHYSALIINVIIGAVIAILPWGLILKNFKIVKIQSEENIPYSAGQTKVRYQKLMPKNFHPINNNRQMSFSRMARGKQQEKKQGLESHEEFQSTERRLISGKQVNPEMHRSYLTKNKAVSTPQKDKNYSETQDL